MKRLLCTILTFSFLFLSLATPASAAETTNVGSLVDLLDYGYCLENGTNSSNFNGNATLDMTYKVSSRITTSYVDVLFMYRTSGEMNVDLMLGDEVKASLSPIRVSGNIWRAYGSFTGYWSDEFTLHFDALTENTNRITILSFEVGRVGNTRAAVEGYMDIIGSDYTNTIHYVPTDETNQRNWTPAAPGTAQFFLYTKDWRKYDYIGFMFNLYVDDITSINCVFGSQSLPFEISYLDSGVLGYMETSISVRVDVSQIDRTADDDYYPMVIITATESVGNLAAVSFIEGVVEFDIESPFVYWMQSVRDAITESVTELGNKIAAQFLSLKSKLEALTSNIIDAIKGDATAADDANSAIDDAVSDLEDIQNELEQATQPDLESEIGNIEVNISSDASGFIGSLFETFISSTIFGPVLIFSVTLALLSYVFYGKR